MGLNVGNKRGVSLRFRQPRRPRIGKNRPFALTSAPTSRADLGGPGSPQFPNSGGDTAVARCDVQGGGESTRSADSATNVPKATSTAGPPRASSAAGPVNPRRASTPRMRIGRRLCVDVDDPRPVPLDENTLRSGPHGLERWGKTPGISLSVGLVHALAQFSARADPEFVIGAGEVAIPGLRADEQFACDVAVSQARGGPPQARCRRFRPLSRGLSGARPTLACPPP